MCVCEFESHLKHLKYALCMIRGKNEIRRLFRCYDLLNVLIEYFEHGFLGTHSKIFAFILFVVEHYICYNETMTFIQVFTFFKFYVRSISY